MRFRLGFEPVHTVEAHSCDLHASELRAAGLSIADSIKLVRMQGALKVNSVNAWLSDETERSPGPPILVVHQQVA
jgi:hypothetical protein